MKKILLILLFLLIVIPLAWVLVDRYEGNNPVVEVSLPSIFLKKSYEMKMVATDPGTGLRKVIVSIMQKGNEKILLEKKYPVSSIASLFSDKRVSQDQFTIPVEAGKYGMTDGEAMIRIRVSDYSWKSWNKGNLYYAEKRVVIDSNPPRIKVLSKQHNVTKGGSGLVLYRLFEPKVKSGVRVGDNFFPGYSGLFADKDIYAAFFALDDTQGPGTRIVVTAEDQAGNSTQAGFYHYIRDKNFKTDTLNISDRFLEAKMPGFTLGSEQDPGNSLLEKYLIVNGKVRQANVEKILSTPEDTVNQMLWTGKFLRLPGAATRSRFADRRIYKYKGKEIDRATHLGIDLASTANAPVLAANSGRVILVEKVGIFGNSVIIDHGFGLASLYSHLSSMAVKKGDSVKKGDVIGNTGMTGLAGGDHLHFSMIVHNVFVTPIEWWDPAWIKNNITNKIRAIGKS